MNKTLIFCVAANSWLKTYTVSQKKHLRHLQL